MSRVECPREQEVLDAIASGRWPNRLSEDLANHLGGCAFCKDLALVAEALSSDFVSAIEQARVPTAGLVWWKAEIRSRQESLRVVSRPIAVARYIGLGCAGIVALTLLSLLDFAPLEDISLFNLIPDSLPIPFIFGTLGVLAILESIALYLALSDN